MKDSRRWPAIDVILEGSLTLHGVTRPQAMPARITLTGERAARLWRVFAAAIGLQDEAGFCRWRGLEGEGRS